MKYLATCVSFFSMLILGSLPSPAHAAQTQAPWTGAADFVSPYEQTPGYQGQRLGGWGGDADDHVPRRYGDPIDHVILFVHGNQSSAANWDDYRAYFQEQGFNDSALWAPSYLGDKHDTGTDVLIEKNAEDLRVFIEAVVAYTGVSKVRIVAHSLGTMVTKDMLYEHRPRGAVVTHYATIAGPHGDKTGRYNIAVIFCRSLNYRNTPACSKELGNSATAIAWRDARVIRDPALEQILVLFSASTTDIFYWSFLYGDARFSPRDNIVGPSWPGEIAYSQHPDQDHVQLKQLNLVEVFDFLTDPADPVYQVGGELHLLLFQP
jgi:pimeloyl-ACP methyl ester carboxylesterase